MTKLKIIECPRDAMQSIKRFIPTDLKIKYIQSLIDVGFDTIDLGSFVSRKVIPQLSDTGEVIRSLDLSQSKTKLLAIIANIKGAEIASNYDSLSCIGYPFSISENFQMRNTNKTISESYFSLLKIKNIIDCTKMDLIVYLSMCFGNPYGEIWNKKILDDWVLKLYEIGIKTISFSDTIGSASPKLIYDVYSHFSKKYPKIEFGLHLHGNPNEWKRKFQSSINSGCNRLDGAIQGFGGCPMASNKLKGNFPTEKLISYCNEKKINHGINALRFETAYNYATDIFKHYT